MIARAPPRRRVQPRALVDLPFTREFARAHEAAGFDRVLVGYYSDAPDGFIVAATSCGHRTARLAARAPAGLRAPTVAARKLADARPLLGRPRWPCTSSPAAATPTSGATATSSTTTTRYRRTDEFLDILRRSGRRTRRRPRRRVLPLRGRLLRPQPCQQPQSRSTSAAPRTRRSRSAAARRRLRVLGRAARAAPRAHRARAGRGAAHGRDAGFSVSLRPILGATEEAAWERAHAHPRPGAGATSPRGGLATAASPRARHAAPARGRRGRRRPRHRLWTAIAAATGARGNTTALVGTPSRWRSRCWRYVDPGVTTLPHPRLRPARRRARVRRDREPRRAEVAVATPWRPEALRALEHGGEALAAADAHRDEAVPRAASARARA